MVIIEAIEGRTLFAANVSDKLIALAEASTSPAVQATLELVKADLTAVNNARGGDARAEFQQIIESSLAQLANGRDALRDARRSDSAVRDAAIASLKSTHKQLKANLAAAKANLRATAVENPTEVREATSSLRQHLKQLRVAVREARNSVGRRPTGSTLDTVPGLITNSYNNGDWLGPGITSSTSGAGISGLTSVGFMSGSDLGSTQFKGVPDANGDDVLVKYTYYGDADLNGTVDPDDFYQFLAGFQDNSLPRTWLYGDYDNNNLIDPDDLNLFLAAYQNDGKPPSEIVNAVETSSLSAADRQTLLDSL